MKKNKKLTSNRIKMKIRKKNNKKKLFLKMSRSKKSNIKKLKLNSKTISLHKK